MTSTASADHSAPRPAWAAPERWATPAAAGLCAPPEPDKARASVRASWRRSESYGADGTGTVLPPYEEVGEAGAPLVAGARPVLDALRPLLGDDPVAIVLANSQGRILFRASSNDELSERLDAVGLAPGFLWHERHVGTNPIGLVLETRRPDCVVGDEHFGLALADLAGAASPILHPVTGRLRGIVGLVTWRTSYPSLLLSTAQFSASAVEHALYRSSSSDEQRLLLRHLAEDRRADVPVIAVNGRVEIANPIAARTLGATDRALLCEAAVHALSTQAEARVSATLEDGREASVHVERVDTLDLSAGYVVRILSATKRTRETATAHDAGTRDEPFVGRSAAASLIRAQAGVLAEQALPIRFSGEPGTGKSTLARRVASALTEVGPIVELDAASLPADAESAVGVVRQAVEGGRRIVILRHLEQVPVVERHALQDLVSSPLFEGSRLVTTWTTSSSIDTTEHEDPGMVAVELPIVPLRERVEDVVDLVGRFLEQESPRLRILPEAMQALIRHSWPGNARELQTLIRQVAARARGREISLRDLPAAYQAAGRQLGRMEHVERNAISRALREAGGNKSRAAELLGIGRATLYRKMHVFGLASDLGVPDQPNG